MNTDSTSQYYKSNWEAYYKSMANDTSQIPWDVTPDKASKLDLDIMSSYFNLSLPLVDIGCGIGTQSMFLKKHFDVVIGTDISDEAIKIANQNYGDQDIAFYYLDTLNLDEIKAFSNNYGPCNLYMRGMLQQILQDDRKTFTEAIKILLGGIGKLYFTELSPDAGVFFLDLKRKLGQFPPQLQRVLTEKVTKMEGVNLNDIDHIFDVENFNVLEKGVTTISLKMDENNHIGVPAVYGLVSLK
ncbi:class I SAM-dependent methyltransferase [Planktosalinus lacus]|uniref:Methyltransferase n=1 Tax=Planktosalinus lacus TaxID=1526573 RepID=A0A8J2Y893_9FLAO|nr:class I SAM-dependent methyltransferase [Planktosalinus lacus]GGE00801.1 methyltransferase [Planktosalinus lacus]